MKKITFGYNATVVNSKEEGNKIEEFKPISFDLDKPTDHKKLEEFFKTHVYTLNKFVGRGNRGQKLTGDYEGFALKQNYKGMYGIGIDYDDGHFTVDQAHEAFKNYVHIIHTSSSHMLDVPRHKGIQPRFRVILPFELSDEIPYLYENEVDAELVYSLLKERYQEADSSVFSMGRKLFPFTGDVQRYIFKLHIPDKIAEGLKSIFYTITFEDIEAHRIVIEAKDSNRKRNKRTDKINRNDIVVLKDRKTKKRIGDITHSGTSCFCLFCDDLDSNSASGQINIDKHGNYNLYCHHCEKTYWEVDLNWNAEVEPNLYFDADIGHAALYNHVKGQVKYFRNDKDWDSYVSEQGLPKEIFRKLPRANQTVDLKEKFGYFEKNNMKYFNIFEPTSYLEPYDTVRARIKAGKQKPMNLSGLPKHIPTIYRVFQNVFGDEENIRLYLNWLAFLIQSREQSSLGWIIISIPGSGKGLLAERILRPIFGTHAVLIDEGDAIGAQFNAEDASCWIKVYNEVFTKSDFHTNLKRREWLKNRIGTKFILIEGKGVNKLQYPNFVNYMLLSNYDNAFILEENDRRFNVVNTLKTAYKITEIKELWLNDTYTNKEFEARIAAEIPALAEFIQNVEYNWKEANEPTDTIARRRLIEFSKEDVDFIISKLNSGEPEYFELETIYPSANSLIGVDANSDIRSEIAEFIEKYHAIPSKYAPQVFGHFMKVSNKTNIKRKLEQRGIIIGKQVWNKENKGPVRCYIHESQVSPATTVDETDTNHLFE